MLMLGSMGSTGELHRCMATLSSPDMKLGVSVQTGESLILNVLGRTQVRHCSEIYEAFAAYTRSLAEDKNPNKTSRTTW